MSNPARFLLRRRRLRRRHICTRCGTDPARRGCTLCAGCMAVKAIKRAPDSSAAEIKALELKRQRLLHRLDLIDEARRAVQDEIDRVA